MQKTNKLFNGAITAVVTPFKRGDFDRPSFVKLLHQQMAQNIDGVVINGTTGESPNLKLDEIKTMYDIARAEARGTGLKVIVGTGSNSTQKTCELSQLVSAWAPEALLVVVPYYNRPPQRGMVQHFQAVAQAASVPIILYNVPSRTVANLDPQSVIELSHHKNICGIKDATGDMRILQEIINGVPSDFCLLSGDDASCVEFVYGGGDGVISVSSHLIGREMKDAMARAKSGEAAASSSYRLQYQEFMRLLYIEANPIPVKMALHWSGILESPELRLPLVALDKKFHGEFKACLKNLKKL